MPHVTEEIWTALPARTGRLIVAPWTEPDGSYDEADRALERVQDAAAIFRRAGVLVGLDVDERRILEAVVRPERSSGDGAVAAGGADGARAEAEVERLRGEVARAERMLANERFVERAAPEVVAAEREKLDRYRRELEALERVVA
jgi:valyl-tRNA synthetase